MKAKVRIAFDGSGYGGWQKQTNALGIQTVFEQALERIHKSYTPVTASGRTDAGVHALGQVVHFEILDSISPRGYYNALNTLLPKDIRVLKVEFVPGDFHARFSVSKKIYEYVITADLDSPFNERYKLRCSRTLDLDKMRRAAAYLTGTHDFTSFTHAKIEENKPRTKTISSIEISQRGKDVILHFEADGFLRYQVRMMSASLIAAGIGKIQPQQVGDMLKARNKEACKFNAPARGLYLVEAVYDERWNSDLCWPKNPAELTPDESEQEIETA